MVRGGPQRFRDSGASGACPMHGRGILHGHNLGPAPVDRHFLLINLAQG